ncbi:hypothetical protein PG299_02575 [Riemerella anatipestifer]|nr:hypothetical protein [Riemerella anatipestifer]
MAKVTNVFVSGRMNSDTTYPLLDNKDFVRAENLRILGVGEDGRFNFMKGSELISDHSDNGQMTIIGGYEGADNILYYFLAQANGKSRIVAYDVERKTSRVVIEDHLILRFDLIRWHQGQEIIPYKYLLSINQIGDLLFISNEVWEYPRVINIKTDYTKGFNEEDIILAKRPPIKSPDILSLENKQLEDSDNDIFVSFSYRYKYVDGDYSALSFYSDVAFTPKDGFSINSKRENTAMVNKWDYVRLGVMSGGKNVTDIEVYAREHGSNTAYLIYSINKAKAGIGDDVFIQDIEYKFSKNYEVLDEDSTNLLYSNIPKFPKTQTAVGNRIFYGNYKEGMDIDFLLDYEVIKERSSYLQSNNRKTAVSLFTYKVGVVFYNKFNESSTVLLPMNQTKSEIKIDFEDRFYNNVLKVEMPPQAPMWADKMKFVVKSEILNYENLYITYANYIDGSLFLLLIGDNVNRIHKGDTVYLIGNSIDDYIEYGVSDVVRKTQKDGVSIPGLYAQIDSLERQIEIKSNGETKIKNYIVDPKGRSINFPVIEGYAEDYMFDASITPPANVFIHTNKLNRGDLKSSDFGVINEGDVVYISLELNYYLNNNSNKRPVSFSKEVIATKDYGSIYDLLLDINFSYYLNVERSGDVISLITNSNFPAYLRNLYPDIFTYKLSYFNNIYLGTSTNIKVVKGIKPLIFRVKNKSNIESFYFETDKTYPVINGKILGGDRSISDKSKQIFDVGFYNGYCWGNGIESYKIKDLFNGNPLRYRFRGNLHDKKGYKQVHRKNDITYSGIYNYDLGINNLSVFNPSQANWLSLPIMNGEIQRLISTDGNITAFQNNKIVDIFYGKSIIADLQGNENVALSKDVLGGYKELPYEYGISENPESVAIYGNLIYFLDKNRSRFLLKAGQDIQELNPPASGMHKEVVDLLRKHHSFLGSYDDAHGEYVVVVDNKFSLSYALTSKGFTGYYTYNTDYNIGVNGKYFSSYKGRLYQNEVTEIYNDFAGQGLHEAKLTFVVNPEMATDKVFNAISLQSNTAWYTKVKTNLTATEFPEECYDKRESYYYTEVQRDSSTPIGLVGVGRVKNKEGNELSFSYEISNQVSVGNTLLNEDASYQSEITAIVGNKISVRDASGFQLNDFIVAQKKQVGHFRPSGVPMRGEWMEVTLSKLGNQPYYISSVSTEITKSWL